MTTFDEPRSYERGYIGYPPPLGLVAAAGNRKLAGDRGEDDLDFVSEPNQNGYGNDGDKSQDQGVLDERLASLTLSLAAEYFFMFH